MPDDTDDMPDALREFLAANQDYGAKRRRADGFSSRFPMPHMDCPYCRLDLRGLASTTASLPAWANPVFGHYWRRHTCPACKGTFISGVPISQAGMESTEDVQQAARWFSRAALLREVGSSPTPPEENVEDENRT